MAIGDHAGIGNVGRRSRGERRHDLGRKDVDLAVDTVAQVEGPGLVIEGDSAVLPVLPNSFWNSSTLPPVGVTAITFGIAAGQAVRPAT